MAPIFISASLTLQRRKTRGITGGESFANPDTVASNVCPITTTVAPPGPTTLASLTCGPIPDPGGVMMSNAGSVTVIRPSGPIIIGAVTSGMPSISKTTDDPAGKHCPVSTSTPPGDNTAGSTENTAATGGTT